VWEAVLIIVTLGGLEILLWRLQQTADRKAEIEDQKIQKQQQETLDGILTELAIQNSVESDE
jgi:hypothetical protein